MLKTFLRLLPCMRRSAVAYSAILKLCDRQLTPSWEIDTRFLYRAKLSLAQARPYSRLAGCRLR